MMRSWRRQLRALKDQNNYNRLSIWHCAELLLKERVRRIHPAHIYQNRTGGSSTVRTITSDRAIFLLESIGNITIDTKDKQAIEECRNIRNQIEHNEFSITQKDARVTVGKMLSFVFTFGSEQLGCNLEEEFKSDDTWPMLLNELYEFTEEYGSRISARLYDQRISMDNCSNCSQENG